MVGILYEIRIYNKSLNFKVNFRSAKHSLQNAKCNDIFFLLGQVFIRIAISQLLCAHRTFFFLFLLADLEL